jgi:hypothetical protein
MFSVGRVQVSALAYTRDQELTVTTVRPTRAPQTARLYF